MMLKIIIRAMMCDAMLLVNGNGWRIDQPNQLLMCNQRMNAMTAILIRQITPNIR